MPYYPPGLTDQHPTDPPPSAASQTELDLAVFGQRVGRVLRVWSDSPTFPPRLHGEDSPARAELRREWPDLAEALDSLQELVTEEALTRYWRQRHVMPMPDLTPEDYR